MKKSKWISPLGESVSDHFARMLKSDPELRALAEKYWLAEQIARLLIRYRMDRRLTPSALGKLLKMNSATVLRLESGQHTPSPETIGRIMTALKKEVVFVDAPGAKAKRHKAKGKNGRSSSKAA